MGIELETSNDGSIGSGDSDLSLDGNSGQRKHLILEAQGVVERLSSGYGASSGRGSLCANILESVRHREWNLQARQSDHDVGCHGRSVYRTDNSTSLRHQRSAMNEVTGQGGTVVDLNIGWQTSSVGT